MFFRNVGTNQQYTVHKLKKLTIILSPLSRSMTAVQKWKVVSTLRRQTLESNPNTNYVRQSNSNTKYVIQSNSDTNYVRQK
jgi:hypothetical protein